MLIRKCNIWQELITSYNNAICVTTNGIVKSNGELVMGKGIALEAVQKYPTLPRSLGHLVGLYGNFPFRIPFEFNDVISFPTKHHYKDNSSLMLIRLSADKIVNITNCFQYNKIFLTKPGCGNGNLNWDDVRPILEEYFDDRFVVCYND